MDKSISQRDTWIPVSLAHYAEKENLIEELRFYLALKLSCSGKIHAQKRPLKLLMELTGISSRTTLNKRLKSLKTLNWIGYNSSSQYYFVRSYHRVCQDLKIGSKTCVEFNAGSFKDFRAFIFATVVGQRIKAMEYAKKRSKEEVKFVPQYWDGTSPNSPPPLLSYNGLPNSSIAELTGKSISRCAELKKLAEEAKFIMTKEKLITVDIMPYNPIIREVLKERYPTKFGRFKIKAIKRGINKGKVRIMEQLADEIIPLLRYRKRKR